MFKCTILILSYYLHLYNRRKQLITLKNNYKGYLCMMKSIQNIFDTYRLHLHSFITSVKKILSEERKG